MLHSKRSRSDKSFQVLLVGKCASGKSALVHRAVAGGFLETYQQTLGCEIVVKQYTGEDFENCALELVSCGGAEHYRVVHQQHYPNTAAILLVYDVTNAQSLTELMFWYNEQLRGMPDAHVFLVGTHSDDKAHMVIPNESATRQALSWHAESFQVSSRSGQNVNELFRRVAKRCLGITPPA